MEKGLQSLQLISFKNEQVSNLLQGLNVKTEKIGDKEVILNELGQVAKCKICEKELLINNLGTITHGSIDIICDNPACIICHLVSKNH